MPKLFSRVILSCAISFIFESYSCAMLFPDGAEDSLGEKVSLRRESSESLDGEEISPRELFERRLARSPKGT
jgi:hypothetical protein